MCLLALRAEATHPAPFSVACLLVPQIDVSIPVVHPENLETVRYQ